MHPVLGTMMPEICGAPHLPDILSIHHRAPVLMMRGVHFFTIQLSTHINLNTSPDVQNPHTFQRCICPR